MVSRSGPVRYFFPFEQVRIASISESNDAGDVLGGTGRRMTKKDRERKKAQMAVSTLCTQTWQPQEGGEGRGGHEGGRRGKGGGKGHEGGPTREVTREDMREGGERQGGACFCGVPE